MALISDQDSVRRPLTKVDWIEAAIEVMVDSSVEQVRVESLARELDVSKGSFYWHFKNRDDLLEAVLERWRHDTTSGVQERLKRREPSAANRLLLFLRLPLRSARAVRSADLELAILGWARRSRMAEMAVAEVDRLRIAHVSGLLEEMGFSPADAELRAHIAYAFIRYISQRRDLDAKVRFDMTTVVHSLLANRDKDASAALVVAVGTMAADQPRTVPSGDSPD
ncbi:MAG: TetR/AcrR family transcriptional regulator [Sphingomonas sp.]